MDFLRSPFAPNPTSALGTPPPRRISTAAGDRLSAVVSDRRPSTSYTMSSRTQQISRWSDSTTMGRPPPRMSHESLPPAYVMTESPLSHHEKVAANQSMLSKRGGWKRVAFIVLIVCLAIGLGIGLGVGLSQRRHGPSSSAGAVMPENNNTATAPAFPVGEYSLVTALQDVETNCTSNSDTWRCFPGPTFDVSPAASLATFNWLLTNTSAVFATNSSTFSTDAQGVAANLSISASDNPLSIVFASTPLLFINDTTPRYRFAANISQKVIPASNITSDNRATVCFFNQTQIIGTLHLTNSFAQQYTFTGNNASYTLWPYSVQVELVSPGGDNTPACYYTNNGVVGAQITGSLTPQPADDECRCAYKNYL